MSDMGSTAIRPGRRRGLSLLEVIIATVVLAVSATMLVKLIGTGDRNAKKAERRVTAQMICQNKLDEILGGIVPLAREEPTPSNYFPGWHYSIDFQQVDANNGEAVGQLALVEVNAFYSQVEDEPGEFQTIDLVNERPDYSLRRILRLRQNPDQDDPEILLGVFE